MQVFVKTLTGKTITVNVQQDTQIADLKASIQTREEIPAALQRLSYGGKPMQDDHALSLYGVAPESTLHLNAELLGGGKKRKKKTYTTPKKIRHKKKKVKLAVLKYYKVDESGKITRLRRECPNASCGAGVFMAWHHDRQYCGKCSLTYVFKQQEQDA